MLIWPRDKDAICAIIASKFSLLKIIVKTKNEKDLFKVWFDHHSKFCGGVDIIIFDNDSDGDLLKSIYCHVSEANVFQFMGNHNLIHDTNVFWELYATLKISCKYFIFIDTDEFLYLTDGTKLYYDVSEFMGARDPMGISSFLGAWLLNVGWDRSLFYLNDIPSRFPSLLRGGKPLINSRVELNGFINHNIQFMQFNNGIDLSGGVFVAHFNMYYKQRRVAVNKMKILAHRFVSTEGELEELIKFGEVSSGITGPFKVYLEEIIACNKQIDSSSVNLGDINTGVIKIEDDTNSLCVSDAPTSALVFQFVDALDDVWQRFSV